MKRLIVASNNEGKIKEIRQLFSKMDYKIVSLKDINLSIEINEDQPDFAGNSLKKAREISKLTGDIVLADDSGLEVEALGGKPGVYSARFAGNNTTAVRNNEKLLSMLTNLPENKRRARFRCVLTMYWPDGTYIQAEGSCTGRIGYTPVGDGGFGYDPLFIVDGYNKTMAELTAEEKNKISHRGIALKALIGLLHAKSESVNALS